jgi:hypothetical protein
VAKIRWWFRKPPPLLEIPPYVPTVVPQPKPEPGIVVEEHDVSDMTKTGVHRAWDRLTGRFKGE